MKPKNKRGRPPKKKSQFVSVPRDPDAFLNEETRVDLDDAVVNQPNEWDVRDELSHLDGYRDYLEESRGNGLTYGDY